MTSAASPSPAERFEEIRPEPRQLWIRFRPRRWPGAAGAWLDLGRLRLGAPGEAGAALPAPPEAPDDVVYLPPAAEGLEGSRRRVAGRLAAAGAPVLFQVRPGGAAPPAGAIGLWDPTEALLAGDPAPLAAVPAGGAALWPLVPGVTDGGELVAAGLGRLAAAGAAFVLPVVPDLTPEERRDLASGEEAYRALFHGGRPSVRSFARAAHRHGLEPFFERPLPGAPPRLASNRALAGHLARIAELWLALGRPESRGQAFFRAARWIDREAVDLARLAVEGNLGVVAWLEPAARDLIEELAEAGTTGLLAELRREYLEGEEER